MNHSFDIEHASSYGVIEAILIGNFQFWIAKNKANGVNFRDERTWTYNSVEAFSQLFPYLTNKQIRYSLEKLTKLEVLVTGNYNERAVDRTKWYAFFDECKFLPGQLHLPKLANGTAKRGKSLDTDVNKDVNADGGRTEGNVAAKAVRATRLPPTFVLPKSWGEWAQAKYPDWSVEYIREVGEKFRDHWSGISGQKGTKTNWDGTWRNWCRNEGGPKSGSKRGEQAWRATDELKLAKGRELNMAPLVGESMYAFEQRLYAAIDNGGVPPAPPRMSRVGIAADPLPPAGKLTDDVRAKLRSLTGRAGPVKREAKPTTEEERKA